MKMNFFRFILDKKFTILFIFMLLLMTNIILSTSTPMDQSIRDILYLNVIWLILLLIYLVIKYRIWVKRYRRIVEIIEQEDTDIYIPKGSNLELELMREIIQLKNKELVSSINKYEEALTEINEYMTKWVHEIKIPLTVCQLLADELEGYDDFTGNKSEELRYELDRIKYYIQQVLYTSRANSYSEDLKIEEIDLEQIVRAVIKDNKNLFIRRRLNIDVNIDHFTVLTDRKWIGYIIEQILSNSCKYADENTTIEIWCENKPQSIELHIKDHGMGINKVDITRVFDKGFTGENGRKQSKSTGMGLYITYKMAKMLNHDIHISSKEKKFTDVCLVFYKLEDFHMLQKCHIQDQNVT